MSHFVEPLGLSCLLILSVLVSSFRRTDVSFSFSYDITSPSGFGLTEVHTGLWKDVLLGKAVKVPCGWSLVSLITPEPIPRHMCASGASLTSCCPEPLAHQTLGSCSMLFPASVFMGFNGLLRDFIIPLDSSPSALCIWDRNSPFVRKEHNERSVCEIRCIPGCPLQAALISIV